MKGYRDDALSPGGRGKRREKVVAETSFPVGKRDGRYAGL